MDIDTNPANYEPNSINDNWPRETPPAAKRGGFESLAERVDGEKSASAALRSANITLAASVLAEPDADGTASILSMVSAQPSGGPHLDPRAGGRSSGPH
ncbi:hypothetical protein MJ575_12310 [Klebsiella pneumoniae]|nr:hypothetical protein MJ575_12310 [Klebsiella pneumoniae]